MWIVVFLLFNYPNDFELQKNTSYKMTHTPQKIWAINMIIFRVPYKKKRNPYRFFMSVCLSVCDSHIFPKL